LDTERATVGRAFERPAANRAAADGLCPFHRTLSGAGPISELERERDGRVVDRVGTTHGQRRPLALKSSRGFGAPIDTTAGVTGGRARCPTSVSCPPTRT